MKSLSMILAYPSILVEEPVWPTEEKLLNIIEMLMKIKSTGQDEVAAELLKYGPPELFNALLDLFLHKLECGSVLQMLKDANLVTI